MAQSGSAPEWGSGGRRFKSSRPDQVHLSNFNELQSAVLVSRVTVDSTFCYPVMALWCCICRSGANFQ